MPAAVPDGLRDERTIATLLERQAEELGDKPFLRAGDVQLTFREFRDVAARYAGTFAEAGLRKGDRLAVIVDDYAALLELWAGCAWSGVILVPIHSALRGGQLSRILANAEPRVLGIDAALLSTLDDLEELPRELQDVWVIGGDAAPVHLDLRCRPLPGPGRPIPAAGIRSGDPLALLYTSGTTGPSKGVVCPHAQFYSYGVNTAQMLAIRHDDVLYTCLPFCHINAFATLMQALLSGAQIVVGPRFSASSFWSRVAGAGATVTYLLGAMVSILAGAEPGHGDRGHRVRIALAPATPPHLHDLFRDRFGIELIEAWAMTETNAVIGPVNGEQRPGYMGRLLPGFDARVVDEDDIEVPDGVAGELIVRADEPFAFSTGYWRLPEATLEVWRNLWFHTGDRVIREPDGYFKLVDRIKDVIRRRGENISAWEVEQVLQLHPDVLTSAVVPVPSELGEEEVMAYIVRRPGSGVSESELIDHCDGKLAYFAVPRFVEFINELPLTETGKPQKYVLRERGVSSATWDRGAARQPTSGTVTKSAAG